MPTQDDDFVEIAGSKVPRSLLKPETLDVIQGQAQPRQPFDDFTDEQRAAHDHALELLEAAKNYREAGHMAVNPNASKYHAQLMQRGGLSQDEATTLARYRMYKLGMPNIPTTPRQAADTTNQIAARRDALLGGTPEDKARSLADSRNAIDQSHEAYFDSLVGQGQ